MTRNKILLCDKVGEWHEIVSVGTRVSKNGLDLYFFFPKNFKYLLHMSYSYCSSLKDNLPLINPSNFSEIHLRYPPDGNVHFSIKNNNKHLFPPTFIKHEPMSSLTSAKRIFSIIPKSAEHYPVQFSIDKILDWKIDGGVIPGFFTGQPICLNFWLGLGSENEILGKASAIQILETRETLKYVQVFSGQDKNLQIFLAVSRPPSLIDFPEVMKLFIQPSGAPKLVRKSKD